MKLIIIGLVVLKIRNANQYKAVSQNRNDNSRVTPSFIFSLKVPKESVTITKNVDFVIMVNSVD